MTEGAILLIGVITFFAVLSIVTGLPFTVVLLIMCFSLYRSLQEGHYHATIIGKLQSETHKIEIPLEG